MLVTHWPVFLAPMDASHLVTSVPRSRVGLNAIVSLCDHPIWRPMDASHLVTHTHLSCSRVGLHERGSVLLLLRGGLLAAAGRRTLALVLVEAPHVAAEGVLVPEDLEAVLARDEGGLGLVHVADVPGERVPGQLLVAVRARLLGGAGRRRRRRRRSRGRVGGGGGGGVAGRGQVLLRGGRGRRGRREALQVREGCEIISRGNAKKGTT